MAAASKRSTASSSFLSSSSLEYSRRPCRRGVVLPPAASLVAAGMPARSSAFAPRAQAPPAHRRPPRRQEGRKAFQCARECVAHELHDALSGRERWRRVYSACAPAGMVGDDSGGDEAARNAALSMAGWRASTPSPVARPAVRIRRALPRSFQYQHHRVGQSKKVRTTNQLLQP